uniref:Uncharacterized protein n=1 Tax=Ditylenchus dipsaci TaxID=166011 RepID=A0A915CPF6_9BILA
MKRASLFYRKFTIICVLATFSGLLLLYYSCKKGCSQPAKRCLRINKELEDSEFKKAFGSKNSGILAAQYQDLLPHLKLIDKKFIDPVVWLRAENVFRSPPQFVLGIPTTHRQQVGQLFIRDVDKFTNKFGR